MSCLDDETVLALLHGTLDPASLAAAREHIESCATCRILVAAVTRSMREESPETTDSTIPRSGAPVASIGSTWPQLSPGDQVDKYRLDEPLGEGGHGVVWAATHVVLHKPVALKFLKSRESDYGTRFLREARIAATLRHPNLVEVFDVLELPNEGLAMVMERLSGESLARRIERGPLPVDEARALFSAIVAGVRHAHAHGVVHRDLKPHNVFLADRPKVLDFGLAKLVDVDALAFDAGAVTRSGVVLGTPHYMAPEQFTGEKDVDARADVWSLGVMLFEALTGERLFKGSGYGPLFHEVTVGQLPRLVARSQVPRDLALLVDAMIERERSRRPSLEEVARALNAR